MKTEGCLTRGNIDHIAFAVPDADAAALPYEKAMGWQRFADFELTGGPAAVVARILGIPRLDRIRSVIVSGPGNSEGRVEFVELTVDGGQPRSELPAGFVVTSYRVSAIADAYRELVAGGFVPLCPPTTIDILGQPVTIASVRGPHPGVIELVGAT